MRDAFVDELLTLARMDSAVMLVVGDLGYGVVDTFARELPDQFLNAGVAEQNMVSMAAGLASTGYRVFVYSIANFPTLRALEQIRNDVCYHELDVTIVSVGAGVSYGALGYTHHAVEDIAIMRALPAMTVVCPADPPEARVAARDAARIPGPRYIRLGKNGERVLHADPTFETLEQPLLLRHGSDVFMLATGSIASQCMEAADLLMKLGIDAGVVSCPTVSPLDQSLVALLTRGIPVVSVEEHLSSGGFGSALLELANNAGVSLNLKRIALSDGGRSLLGSAEFLRASRGLSPDSISRATLDFLGR